MTLAELERQVERDLAKVAYPAEPWVKRPPESGLRDVDVLIVGAGQGGLTVAAHLLQERVTSLAVIDAASEGEESIWRGLARMKTLRTAKVVTGPDIGLPNLTFQSWFEAQHGEAAFAALGKIDKGDWQDYLDWIRRVLKIPVRNRHRLVDIRPAGEGFEVVVAEPDGEHVWRPRKLVLALGIETSGRWWMPPDIENLPSHLRAHTADTIDFAALAGRRVAVIGAGASAFDNASAALEAGAAAVTLLCRRAEIQRVQPYKIIANPGFLRHFGSLPDADRWRVADHLLTIREAFPRETWDRATRHHNFHLRTGAGVQGARQEGDHVVLQTAQGPIEADFVIAGTGFDVDLTHRPELASIVDGIATWGDRYTPPAGDANPRLARYPYLDSGMAFVPKRPGVMPWLKDIYCFNFGATASFGPSGSSISALKFAAPRVVESIVRDLFVADVRHHEETLRSYTTPEFDLVFARDL